MGQKTQAEAGIMISYYQMRNKRSQELDRMIFDHRPPSEILDFIAESEDVEDVIADSALRFRLFHVDIISGLRVRDRGRLASLTKYLPEAVVQEIVDEHFVVLMRIFPTSFADRSSMG